MGTRPPVGGSSTIGDEGDESVNAAIWTPYCGTAPLPGALLDRWNLDPLLLLGLAAAAWALWRWSRNDVAQRRAGLAAMAVLVVLFVSPLCALTSALFSVRVVHHLLLAAVAAPLLSLALPVRIGGGLAAWTGIHAVAFWGWHAPPLYGWALASDAAYWLMQATLLGSAFAFWSAVRQASVAGGIAALLGTMVLMGLLGALITFAGAPLYAPHFATTLPWGLAPLADQQLAGLIMWAPGAGFYLAAALSLLSRWFARERGAAAA